MEKFKYFKLSFEKPHSEVKTFHQFCLAKNYYVKGYDAFYGYVCPRCWGNGWRDCKFCAGRGIIKDRGPIIEEYKVFRREYRKAKKLWEDLYEKWLAVIGKLSEEEIDLMEIFGLYK